MRVWNAIAKAVEHGCSRPCPPDKVGLLYPGSGDEYPAKVLIGSGDEGLIQIQGILSKKEFWRDDWDIEY